MGEIGMEKGAYGRLFVIPQIKSDFDFLEAVDSKTRTNVGIKYGSFIDYKWHCNTVANGLIEIIISTLAFKLKSNPSVGVGINFFDLFNAQVSIKKNSKAEKEGNINIFFNPGSIAEELIKNGPDEIDSGSVSTEEFFSTHDPKEDEFYSILDYNARYMLAMRHGLTFTDRSPRYTVFGVTYEFIKNIYIELLYRLQSLSVADSDREEHLVSVNFNDNIEFHGILKDGHVTLTMRPGMNAKLLIKCDEITENTMGSDDD